MRCRKARRLISELSEGAAQAAENPALAQHLESCATCRDLLRELTALWQVMGSIPVVESSPDFLAKFQGRLGRAQGGPRHRRLRVFPVAGWQWMALAACVLVVGILLTLNAPVNAPVVDSARLNGRADAVDELLIKDVEQSLSRKTDEYLQVYDSWSIARSEPSDQETGQSPRTGRQN